VLVSLVVSLVLLRLDYGNATLAGLPGYLIDRLQSILNAAAWLVNPVGEVRERDAVTTRSSLAQGWSKGRVQTGSAGVPLF